jgi:hypothetical protein
MVLIGLLLGCGRDPIGSSLEAPWGDMHLPIQDGEIADQTSTDMHVVYADAQTRSIDDFATTYGARLERSGWVMQDARRLGGVTEVTFVKERIRLRVILTRSGKRVDIQVELK